MTPSVPHPLRHSCTPSVIPLRPLHHSRAPSVIPAQAGTTNHPNPSTTTPTSRPTAVAARSAPPSRPTPPLVSSLSPPPSFLRPLHHSCAGRNHEPPKPINDNTHQPSHSGRRTIRSAVTPNAPTCIFAVAPSVIPAPPPSFLRRQEPRTTQTHQRQHPPAVPQRSPHDPLRRHAQRPHLYLRCRPLRHSSAPLRHSCAGRNHEPPKPINDNTHQPSHSGRRTIRSASRPTPPLVSSLSPPPSFLRPLRHSCAGRNLGAPNGAVSPPSGRTPVVGSRHLPTPGSNGQTGDCCQGLRRRESRLPPQSSLPCG